MKYVLTLLVAILVGSIAWGQTSLRRIPSTIAVEALLGDPDAEMKACSTLLTGPNPSDPPCRLALMQARAKQDDPSNARLEAGFFVVRPDDSIRPVDYKSTSIPTSKLQDTDNSRAYTRNHIKDVLTGANLASDATVIVAKGSPIDTSLVIQLAGATQFVIEQSSEPKRFAQNLGVLKKRTSSQDLTVFDFSPRSASAISAMNVGGSEKAWRAFSDRIRDSIRSEGGESALGIRTADALRKRLSDERGGVVVLYAHSDGRTIWLDTDDGLVQLSPSDIEKMTPAKSGRLPPVILLNCETKSQIAPAFIQAGSPFVVATDKPLPLDSIERFVKVLARKVFRDRLDVIDAYFDAQVATMPYRLRPMAKVDNGKGDEFIVPKTPPTTS